MQPDVTSTQSTRTADLAFGLNYNCPPLHPSTPDPPASFTFTIDDDDNDSLSIPFERAHFYLNPGQIISPTSITPPTD